jgi:hypothetical protein
MSFHIVTGYTDMSATVQTVSHTVWKRNAERATNMKYSPRWLEVRDKRLALRVDGTRKANTTRCDYLTVPDGGRQSGIGSLFKLTASQGYITSSTPILTILLLCTVASNRVERAY